VEGVTGETSKLQQGQRITQSGAIKGRRNKKKKKKTLKGQRKGRTVITEAWVKFGVLKKVNRKDLRGKTSKGGKK